jgi:ankyrin repeat protein
MGTRFRWVSCQLDHLCDLPTDKARRLALKELPKTLHGSYERLLLRLRHPLIILLVQKSLRWIAYATPKLSLEKLLDVLSLDDDEITVNHEDRPDSDSIFQYCGSLVRKGQTGDPELAHFTVLEYLEAIDPEDSHLGQFRLTARDNSHLASTCVRYLSAANFSRPQTAIMSSSGLLEFGNQHPFHYYAARKFIDERPDIESDSDLTSSVARLFHPSVSFNVHLIILQRVHDFHYDSNTGSEARKICSFAFGPLHAAATLNLTNLCQLLLDQGHGVNEQSPLGSPLECALFGCKGIDNHVFRPDIRSRIATVRLLLSQGADCKAKSTRAYSFSYVAASSKSLFFEMLKYGMPIHQDTLVTFENTTYGFVGDRVNEYKELVESLEERQVSYQTQLHLLRAIHRSGTTAPLQRQLPEIITDEEFVDDVKFSVQHNYTDRFENLTRDPRYASLGIDITPFAHFAAANNFVDTMRVLIKLCPDVITKTDSNGKTSWHVASCSGSDDILRLLLQTRNGDCTDLQVKCLIGHTPIISAIANCNTSCAILILDVLLATSAHLDDYEILHYATAAGLYEVLERLKQVKFDFTTTDETGCTALFFITAHTPYKVVDLLLEQGINPGHCNHAGMTALHSLLSSPAHLNILKSTMEGKIIAAAVFEKIISSSSAVITDNDGHLPWYHLCSNYIPRIYSFGLMYRSSKELEDLLRVLSEHAACSAYDVATSSSGISLLIQAILDLDPDLRLCNEELFTFCLTDAIFSKSTLLPRMDDSQLIRLTICAIERNAQFLVESLLNIGVDVLSPSKYYGGLSVFSHTCKPSISIDYMKQVVDKADPRELSKPANSFRWGPELFAVTNYIPPDSSFCPKAFHNNTHASVDAESITARLNIILKRGVDANCVANRTHGNSLILEAARLGFLAAVKMLDHHEADVNYVNESGWDIYALAVWGENVALVQFLLDRTRLPQIWTRRYTYGHPNDSCSGIGQHEGFSLFHFAAMKGTVEMLEVLRDSGFFLDLNLTTQKGYTPLHIAAEAGQFKNIKWLIENHVEVNPRTTICGSTPLHFAMTNGGAPQVMVLVQSEARFLPNASGKTPESVTRRPGLKSELLELLPHCGVKIPPFVLENLGRPTEFFQAIVSNDFHACVDAIMPEISVDVPFSCGCTPLYTALAHRRLPMVDLFLENNASTTLVRCEKHSQGLVDVVNFAIADQYFNFILGSLLRNSLKSEDHSINRPCQPLHIAAALNPEAIDIIVDHMNSNANLYA